jgi:tetratricopeptide (TPR) repeat protein/tRNA A-37 threonylcarbamoyl transferase component Bud32
MPFARLSLFILAASLRAFASAEDVVEDSELGSLNPKIPRGVAASPYPTENPEEHVRSFALKIAARRDPRFERLASSLNQMGATLESADPQQKQVIIDEALPELNAAAEEIDDPGVNNDVAYLNNRRGNWKKAYALAERNLDRDPNDRDALINRSAAQHGLGRFEKAFEDADRAAKVDPQSPAALTARALASYGRGHYLQSLEDAQKALALDPNDRIAFSLVKLAEGRAKPESKLLQNAQATQVQREYQGMVSQLNRVEVKQQEAPPPPTVNHASANLNRSAAERITMKDYWSAIDFADKAIAADQTNADSFYYRATAYNLLGEHEKAADDATQALAIDPAHTAARDARSWAYYRLGRFREAIADANHSLEVDPKNAYAFANRGFANEKIGDLDSMMIDLQMAASLNPQFEPSYRDAAAANHLTPLSMRGGAPPAQPGTVYRRRKDSFLMILTSSVIGGFLIALGLLHIISGQWTQKMTAELKRVQTGSRPTSKLDAGYQILGKIGQGGMGVVYEAIDKALDRKVAIKSLRPELKEDSHERDRFLQEARTVASLHHPSIVEIHSIIEDDAGLYLIFEHIKGRSVEELLEEKKRLTLNETKAILKSVCQALEFAHKRGIVHRDLKPSNIMITEEGEVKVMDFGIARQAKDAMTKSSVTNSILGTPQYMAPEQEEGLVRKESDVFGLGACLYEMLTGERPYPGTPMKNKHERNYDKPSRLILGIPPEVDRLVDAALHPDPDRRLPTPREFWRILDQISVHG